MKRLIQTMLLSISLSIIAAEPVKPTGPANPVEPAKSASMISIELNRLEPSKDTCITYFLLKNNTKYTYTAFKTEFIIFDKQDIISTRVLGDFKKVRPGKSVVKLFGIPKTSCDSIHKILINDVHQCMVGEIEKTDCLDLLEPSHKSTTTLFK